MTFPQSGQGAEPLFGRIVMSMKRFFVSLLMAALFFISGVIVGKYVLSSSVEIVVVDVEKLAVLIEKSNAQAEEIKKEMTLMKEWNENALVEEPKKEDK